MFCTTVKHCNVWRFQQLALEVERVRQEHSKGGKGCLCGCVGAWVCGGAARGTARCPIWPFGAAEVVLRGCFRVESIGGDLISRRAGWKRDRKSSEGYGETRGPGVVARIAVRRKTIVCALVFLLGTCKCLAISQKHGLLAGRAVPSPLPHACPPLGPFPQHVVLAKRDAAAFPEWCGRATRPKSSC